MDKSRVNFFLVYLSILSFSIYPWVHAIDYGTQIYFALGLIFVFGIPHGAIDHVIFFEAKKASFKEVVLFYVVYLGLMGLYTVFWLLWPYYSLIFFLLISALHFGQSQFSFVKLQEANPLKILVYLSWGASLLMGLTYYHFPDVNAIFQQAEYFKNFDLYITENLSRQIFLYSTIFSIILITGVTAYYQSWSTAVQEIVNFGLLHLVFYLLPPLIGFTVYFVFWHSIQVMMQEFAFLKTKMPSLNLGRFIRILTPHSLISIVGAVMLIFTFDWLQLDISPIILVLIFLSVLTLPHALVMNKMYKSKV